MLEKLADRFPPGATTWAVNFRIVSEDMADFPAPPSRELLKLVLDIEETLTADGRYRLLREACRAAIDKARAARS